MKYTVFREKFFSAAHRLREYAGKCENLHGHNWRVRLYVSREALDKTGFVADFKVLDKVLKKVLDSLDHRDINALPYFEKVNPTAENIGVYIFNFAQKEFDKIDNELRVVKVSVWESEKSCAIIEL